MRRIGLFLALAGLAGCDHDSSRYDVRLTVTNSGVESVRLEVEVDHTWDGTEERERLVSPGSSRSFTYDDVKRLKLRVFRTSDDFKIFDDFWDSGDLHDLDDRVNVTVTP